MKELRDDNDANVIFAWLLLWGEIPFGVRESRCRFIRLLACIAYSSTLYVPPKRPYISKTLVDSFDNTRREIELLENDYVKQN
jgi:hypothetical protein